MRKLIPITLGVFLGAVSIIMGQMPFVLSQFLGLRSIGTHLGYCLGALAMAWLFHESWRKGFIASFVCMTAANITYYLSVLAFYLFGFGRSPFPPPPYQTLMSFVLWTVISAIICVLAATAVWMARYAKSKLVNYGIFAIAYIGLIGVIFLDSRMFVVGLGGIRRSGVSIEPAVLLAGYLFEIGFSFVMMTAVLGIGLRAIVKGRR